MLLSKAEKFRARSTGCISAKGFLPFIEMLATSFVLYRYDRDRCRPGRDPKFSAVQMLTLIFFMEIKKMTFEELDKITGGGGGQKVLGNLHMPQDRNGRYIRPSDGWISDFRNHEYPLFREDLESEIRSMVLREKNVSEAVFTVDSTPIEASRYSSWADFNVHYGIRMAKAHIIMVDGIPLTASFTNGNDQDCPEFLGLLEGLEEHEFRGAHFYSDGGYDSCEAYLRTFSLTGTVMDGNIRSNAVFHKEASLDNLVRRYNGLHRLDGFRPSGTVSPGFMMKFLESHGDDVGGWFLRNLNLSRGKHRHKEASKKRHICETVHRAMKRWVDLTVRDLHKAYAGVRTLLRLTVCTLLSLMFKPYTK